MSEEKKETKKTEVRSGIPMNEEELKEWQQSFQDIEDSIQYCKEHKNE